MGAMTSPLMLLLLVAASAAQLRTGQQCTTSNGETGVCTSGTTCQYSGANGGAVQLKSTTTPCSSDNNTPSVCCALKRFPGDKAKRKCEEYSLVTRHKRAVLPRSSASLAEEDTPEVHHRVRRIVGGTPSLPTMYPHMAAVGFGDEDNISWKCGGSLISERYVLTAAQCITANIRDFVKWVLLGVVDLTNATSDDNGQLFSVVEWIRYPDYNRGSYYNDIALLKLDNEVRMNDYVRPACLQTSHDFKKQSVIALGYGLTSWMDFEPSQDLLLVELHLVSASECDMAYRSLIGHRRLMFGIQDDKMMCAGEKSDGKDTCNGDAGGPLQYSLDEPSNMNSVVGVTSFGPTLCGSKATPSVFVRVSYYVPWIEGIVWP